MASRTLRVVLAVDSSQLNKGFRQAEGRMKGFQRAAGIASAAVGGALVVGLKQSVKAAQDAEKSNAKLQAQLRASGISFRRHGGEIEQVIQKHSRLAAVDDEDLQDAFTNIVRTTGDVDKSMRLVGLAADIARAKNLDLAKAGEIVGKVAGGNTGVLSRYGIQIEKGATATQALGTLQQRFAGQAEAYGKTTAGAQDRFRVAVENLQESVGRGLLPILTTLANKFADVAAWMERNKTAAKVLLGAAAGLAATLGTLAVATRIAGAFATLRTAVLAVNVAMRANPIGVVVTALTALGAGLVIAYRRSETFRRTVDGAFAAVRSSARAMAGAFTSAFGAVRDAITGAVRTITGAAGRFRSAGVSLGEALMRGIRGALGGVGDVARSLVNAVIGLLNNAIPNKIAVPGPLPDINLPDNPIPRLRRGGTVPGSGRGDRVPAMLEPGEFVMRRKVVERFGPTFFAALNGGEGQPQARGYQMGGIVTRAQRLERMRLPYLWGGGHGPPIPNPNGMDCSGAVSYVLGIPPRVSGQLMRYGAPGPGPEGGVRIFANPEHVFMQIAGKYFGTSRENPAGGPGWHGPRSWKGFAVRHLPGAVRGGSTPGQPLRDVAKKVGGTGNARRLLGGARGGTSGGGVSGGAVTASRPAGGPLGPVPGIVGSEAFGYQGGIPDQQTPNTVTIPGVEGEFMIVGGAGKKMYVRVDTPTSGGAGENMADLLRQQIEIQKALADELKRQNDFAVSVANITSREAVRFMGDLLSSQVGAQIGPRGQSAGAGNLSRY